MFFITIRCSFAMKRKFQLAAVLLLPCLVFIIGLKGTFDGYYGFYYEDREYTKPVIYQMSEAVVQSEPVSLFLSYTGFDTGYGFFAPNVASDFVLMFDLKDAEGNTLQQRIMPRFEQKESMVRYTSMFNMFLEKIKQEPKDSSVYIEYLDIVIRQIAQKVKSEYPGAATVDAKLYLYDYPSLERYRNGETKENAILVSEYKI